MVKAKLITDHVFRHDNREDFLHSSGYAKAQNGGNFGAASTESFAARQAIDEHRKFVQGYRNSKIMNSAYGVQRARAAAGYGGYGHSAQDSSSPSASGSQDQNPMDAAMRRSQFSASHRQFGTSNHSSRYGKFAPSSPSDLASSANSRAPQIPTRRAGI